MRVVNLNRNKEGDLNNKQKIVLIIGAAALLYAILSSPKISIVKGTYITPPPDKKDVARIIDVSTAMMRAFAVLGATFLVSIALKDKKAARRQFTMDKNPILGDDEVSEKGSVKRSVIAKILGFVKDFF